MSIPRAATSEHTSKRSSLALNFSSVEKRTLCGRSPCSAPAEKPCLSRDFSRISTSRLRLQKISAFCTSSERISRRSASRLSCSFTSTSPEVMVVATVAGLETVIVFGLFRKASARRRISGAMVAEKNSVWRLAGSMVTMRSISGMKPISSMRSASSITSTPTSRMISPPRSNKSIRRPGVAISTSTPLLSASFWSAMLSPPISSAWLSLRYLPYCTKFSATCRANSRVGSRMSERGMRARARLPERMSSSGRVKLAVLPVPVWAQPRTSRPISTLGMACAWIGVGRKYPFSCRAFNSGSERPSGPKPSSSAVSVSASPSGSASGTAASACGVFCSAISGTGVSATGLSASVSGVSNKNWTCSC